MGRIFFIFQQDVQLIRGGDGSSIQFAGLSPSDGAACSPVEGVWKP